VEQDPIVQAIRQMRRLPGIGEKTATRLVYWMLRAPKGLVGELGQALVSLSEAVRECSRCRTFSATDPCPLCRAARNDDLLCVVEEPADVLAFERSGEYRGRYHVLHGALSPLEGVTPDQLRIRELLERLRDSQVREVILATNPTVEGDATALYLSQLLGPVGLKVTRLAHGLSVGTEIEYASAVSLARALQDRRQVNPVGGR
jgi:recombination protein RecR